MFGVLFFFGAVALSMVTQRGGPPPSPIFVVRAEPVEKLAGADAGWSLVILLAVIGAAIWLL